MKPTVVLGLLLLLGGCTEAEGPSPRALTARDSALAEALATLMLADARAETTRADADSLRAEAYALTAARYGLDSATLHATLARLARDPASAEPVFRLAADRLDLERRGLVP